MSYGGEAPDRKGLITRREFMEKIAEERAMYQRMLHKVE